MSSETEDIPVGINLSGGASSRWMLEAIGNGLVERPRHVAAFLADPGDEHEWTYEEIGRIKDRCKALGVPLFLGSHHEPLVDAVLSATRRERTRIDNPPYWTENQGGGRGQLTQKCTQVWKTAVIRRLQSAWLKAEGLPKRISTWIGFAAEEGGRATKALARNDVQWATLDFPAIRFGRGRAQQRAELTKWGIKPAKFSMCRKCPYKTEERWRQTSKSDLEGVFEFDEAIRDGLANCAVEETCFLSDALIPVEQLLKHGRPQTSLPGFGAPGCDSGFCFL